MMQVDVLLCSAPFMSVLRPSIALGTLQQALIDGGIHARSRYFNVLLAQEIGLDLNERVSDGLPTELLFGEWLFSACLGPEPRGEVVQRYLRMVKDCLGADFPAIEALRTTKFPNFARRAAESIVEARPRVVGFSLMFQQTAASLAIARQVKALDPSIQTCFGGANCHGVMGETLLQQFAEIDHIFTGEADQVFPLFIQRLLAGSQTGPLSGVISRAAPSEPLAPALTTRLDELPTPNYDDYFEQLKSCSFAGRVRCSIPFESARGCWWGQKHHCTFCGLNGEGMAFREKSGARVVQELDSLSERYGIRRFSAADNILGMRHISSVMEPLAVRSSDRQPGWLFYEIKSNLSERQLETLARAGVAWVQPGIEALCDETLRLMRKGVSALLNIRTLRNCRELGIGVVWNVLHGFPGESSSGYAGMASLLPMLEHLQPPTGCRKLRIDRFSPNFNQAAQLGFSDVRPAPAYAAIFNVPDHALENMAYFFEGIGFPLADDESIQQVMAGVQRWHAAWYRAGSAPSLHSHDVSPGLLVFDTRRVAVKAMHYLGADEATVLKCLREPTAVHDIETRGVGQLPAVKCKSVLQQLIAQRLVLEIDGVAMSLLTEAERSVYNAAAPADFPLGYVIAGDRSEVATHADEAVLLPAD